MKIVINMIILFMAIFFLAPNLIAASARCTIVKIEGTKMTIDCPRGAERFKETRKIKIKSVKKKR